MNEMHYSDHIINRFISKIDFPENPEESDDCWIWTGSYPGKNVKKNPYGQFDFSINRIKYHQRVNRFCYEYYYGPIPNGLHVLHTCDNSKCVNINHLWLGTNKDNVDDKVRKNRHAHGETHSNAILDEQTILDIYNYSIHTNKDVKHVAKVFSIRVSHIKHIVNGVIWKHLYKNISKEDRRKMMSIIDLTCTPCLNEDIVKQIKYHDLKNMKISDIAQKYNVSVQTIYYIKNNKTWSYV